MAGDQAELKEILIGFNVFDRKPDFDPGTDPIVRSEARRRRIRFHEYYEGPGKIDPVSIHLPKGTYVPVFSRRQSETTDGLDIAADLVAATQPFPQAKSQPANGVRAAWLAGFAVLALFAIAGGYFSFHRTVKLTDKDSIVLADFANNTGDPVFDETLQQGLSVQVEQSPFLSVIPESKVNQTLKLMGRVAGDRLTPEVAREVCQRAAGTAVVERLDRSLRHQYVVGLKAVNCDSGDLLAQVQVQANRKEEVLSALDRATAKLRNQLGESLGSVQKYATPLAEATTSSMEALTLIALGKKKEL